MTTKELVEQTTEIPDFLIGSTVTDVRWMEESEIKHIEDEFGYHLNGRPLVIVFGEHTHYIFPWTGKAYDDEAQRPTMIGRTAGTLILGNAKTSSIKELRPAPRNGK